MLDKLFFGFGNSKLSDFIATFSLPAGFTCKFAKECHSWANRKTGEIMDGKHSKFRCYAASEEAIYLKVRISRWHNYELLKKAGTIENQSELIQRSLPIGRGTVRIHVSGDFFSESYFLAWLNVAINNPNKIFYGYTKCLPYLVKYQKQIPPNFRFTASKGGTKDDLIDKYKLKYAEVVFSPQEARQKKLKIDHDDSLAIRGNKSFSLLLHGTQPKNSEASKALSRLRRVGLGFYNKETKFFNEKIKILKAVINKNKWIFTSLDK